MRKVHLLEYSCPVCNADLDTVSVDFSVQSWQSQKTVTTMQCVGCQEHFYSVEEAHLLAREKSPKLDCLYCGGQCSYLSLLGDFSDYWKCLPCKTTYEQRYKLGSPDIQTVNMYATIRGKLYVMRQLIDQGKTRVELLPENLDDTVIIAKEFPFLFPNITPSNIEQKLMTYLLFS